MEKNQLNNWISRPEKDELFWWKFMFLFLFSFLLLTYVASKKDMIPASQIKFAKDLPYRSSDKYDMISVIIEPRDHPLLEYVIDMMVTNYPPVMLFHGNNKEHLEKNKKYKKYYEEGLLIYQALPLDNMSVGIYSGLLLHEKFWECIPSERIFIFQTDATLCNKTKAKIEDFDHLDYVGGLTKWGRFFNGGGNGGISLRNRSAMIRAIKNCTNINTDDLPEDLFYSKCFNDKPWLGKSANQEESALFGTDTNMKPGLKTFTAHKPTQLNLDQQKELFSYCDGARKWIDYSKSSQREYTQKKKI